MMEFCCTVHEFKVLLQQSIGKSRLDAVRGIRPTIEDMEEKGALSLLPSLFPSPSSYIFENGLLLNLDLEIQPQEG